MVGAIAFGALVHGLGRENFLQRQLRIRRNAVREADIRGPAFLRPKDVIRHARHHGLLLLGGAVEDVAAEAAEVRGAALAHNSLGDHSHTCPYRVPESSVSVSRAPWEAAPSAGQKRSGLLGLGPLARSWRSRPKRCHGFWPISWRSSWSSSRSLSAISLSL